VLRYVSPWAFSRYTAAGTGAGALDDRHVLSRQERGGRGFDVHRRPCCAIAPRPGRCRLRRRSRPGQAPESQSSARDNGIPDCHCRRDRREKRRDEFCRDLLVDRQESERAAGLLPRGVVIQLPCDNPNCVLIALQPANPRKTVGTSREVPDTVAASMIVLVRVRLTAAVRAEQYGSRHRHQ
jgi:hypothetical protein